MKTTYQAPEAVIVEFDDNDLLKMSPGDTGDKVDVEW